ncbi:MAG: sugar ABC transporter ATP-binding protein [Synergistaceae bacterium]|jgi:ribose transport system ATP-binding protein|nr:sugar ABC transporter ATP-binding protein [Synergistaceae bacterium]
MENLLELRGVSKSFGQNQVLFNVDFTLKPGEVHGIIGENGAGKSTMMNIIAGLLEPDSGEILIEGKRVEINNPFDAQKKGIGFVHQEIALCQDVSVAQNIFMSEIAMKAKKKLFMNYRQQTAEARVILKKLDSEHIDPNALVMNLSISSQQVVEIAKALSTECRILILDEPTAALTETETNALYKIMHQLTAQGIGIIYISHRMSEIFEQCDRVSVLRDGFMISRYEVRDANLQQLVNDMAGREVTTIYPAKSQVPPKTSEGPLLKVENLTDENDRFIDVSFSLYRGEILGFSGLVGSGRSEVMQGVTGLRRLKRGRVELHGNDITGARPSEIFSRGLLYMTEDRKQSGLFLGMSLAHNTSSIHLSLVTKRGVINYAVERELARRMIRELGIKASGIGQEVMDLSGGNQQKVLLAKLLAKRPEIVILDEPTRGIDVAAKAEIHQLLRKLVEEGIGVVIVSSELNEIIGMCDRIAIMNEGRLVGEVSGEAVNPQRIMYFASGAFRLDKTIKEEKETKASA